MNDNPKYVMYRNKRIPRWWKDYLPEEKNPYKKEDTLTLAVGCLSDYWHIHSSNKHPNFRGAEACNAVQEMVYYHFGGAFLSGGGGYGGHQGQKRYHEPEHLYYENAYLEDGKIHIKDAWQYYEDVITFVLKVLQTVSSNHMQSGMDYDAKGFFPVGLMTDAQVEEAQKANRLRIEKIKIYWEECWELINSTDFEINEIEYSDVSFNASYTLDDDWINVHFAFNGFKTNINKENGIIRLLVDVPSLVGSSFEKKDPSKATKTLDMPYCLYICCWTAETFRVILPIPNEKVSLDVKKKIQEACEYAMSKYNESHMDEIVRTDCAPVYTTYPYNFFLDNNIGKLNLVYTLNAGYYSWRYRYLFLST